MGSDEEPSTKVVPVKRALTLGTGFITKFKQRSQEVWAHAYRHQESEGRLPVAVVMDDVLRFKVMSAISDSARTAEIGAEDATDYDTLEANREPKVTTSDSDRVCPTCGYGGFDAASHVCDGQQYPTQMLEARLKCFFKKVLFLLAIMWALTSLSAHIIYRQPVWVAWVQRTGYLSKAGIVVWLVLSFTAAGYPRITRIRYVSYPLCLLTSIFLGLWLGSGCFFFHTTNLLVIPIVTGTVFLLRACTLSYVRGRRPAFRDLACLLLAVGATAGCTYIWEDACHIHALYAGLLQIVPLGAMWLVLLFFMSERYLYRNVLGPRYCMYVALLTFSVLGALLTMLISARITEDRVALAQAATMESPLSQVSMSRDPFTDEYEQAMQRPVWGRGFIPVKQRLTFETPLSARKVLLREVYSLLSLSFFFVFSMCDIILHIAAAQAWIRNQWKALRLCSFCSLLPIWIVIGWLPRFIQMPWVDYGFLLSMVVLFGLILASIGSVWRPSAISLGTGLAAVMQFILRLLESPLQDAGVVGV